MVTGQTAVVFLLYRGALSIIMDYMIILGLLLSGGALQKLIPLAHGLLRLASKMPEEPHTPLSIWEFLYDASRIRIC
jgi:hypothetical protein